SFLFLLLGLGMMFCVTGCKTDPQPPVTGWNPKKPLEVKTPYLIRTMEKNAMDALSEEPVTRYTIKAYYPEYAAQQFTPLNEEIHAYVKAKVDDFADVMLAGSYTKAFPQDSLSSMTLDFTPSFQSKHFVSLVFEGYEQTPALPKGFHYYKSFNYDALNDKYFTLPDCLVGESEFKKLAGIMAKRLAEQNPDLNETDIQNGTSAEFPENYETFVLRPGELTVIFQPRQLGRRVKNSLSVTVSFNEIVVQPMIMDLLGYESPEDQPHLEPEEETPSEENQENTLYDPATPTE
ncbi:MAG: hypothetical protein J5672_02595, partial [Verrucomicrobia bacterium]|nr:hypothetical protein [Verrucomicrobiota bacterium]